MARYYRERERGAPPPIGEPYDDTAAYALSLEREYIRRYSPEPRYRYAEEQPVYVDQYGHPVEVVRVRQPQPQTRYVQAHPGQEGVEYEYQSRQPIYEERPYMYYEDRRGYGGEVPRRMYKEGSLMPRTGEREEERYADDAP